MEEKRLERCNNNSGAGFRAQLNNPDDDPFYLLEERFAAKQEDEGYEDGFERGKCDGRIEGEQSGEQEGARRGSELGYLQGYAMTYKQLLFFDDHDRNNPNDRVSREEKSLSDLLKLIEDYPRTNETNCEEKLETIRVKFNRVQAGALQLNVHLAPGLNCIPKSGRTKVD